jgi:thioredoxin-related protein
MRSRSIPALRLINLVSYLKKVTDKINQQMRKLLSASIIILISLTTISAQDIDNSTKDTPGIRFDQKLKWSEIIAKAKQDHKYIFVDCYATWCAPCKWMEANVYSSKEVGDVYNKNFIAVKIQMDQTATDDSLTKSRYPRAKTFEQDYHVNAYPTFLFFDENGNPVHKTSGALNANQFIQLAWYAKNPKKQYYAILKNFQPGKLDTAEEKSLAWSLMNSDKQLAGKLAGDYLCRIPKAHLGDRGNLIMLIAFQENSQIQLEIANYLHGLPKNELGQGNNLRMIQQIKDNREVKRVVLNYIFSLNEKDISKEENMALMRVYHTDPKVQQVVKDYFDGLTGDEMLDKQNLEFTFFFTKSTEDKSFVFVYNRIQKIDSIMGKNWAEGSIRYWISDIYWQPEFEHSRQSGKTPDFNALNKRIVSKSDAMYSTRIIADAKVDWFSYEVDKKKLNEYWPEYTTALIDLDKILLSDGLGLKAHMDDINNTCYGDIFLHSTDTAQLNLAVKWMAELAAEDKGPPTLDTYACCLYKDKQVALAIETERKAMELARKDNWPSGAKQFAAKIADMKNGYPIWERKEYQ